MKILVIGTGYVGLVTGTCFAETGVETTCLDIDEEKIENLKKGIIPIYEPGLTELVQSNYEKGRLHFTTDISEGIKDVEVIFIAVGTPPGEDGSADLQYVLQVAKDIGTHISNYAVVVTKSTVPVGTSEKVKAAVRQALKSRGVFCEFSVASNPEFLKEGTAVNDFMKPDRIVCGTEPDDRDDKAKEILEKLYHPFILNGHPIYFMDIISSEMTKYAANSFLATKISFVNEVAALCEKVGANYNMVRKGIGSDPRVGNKFIYAGTGYGGSCFPKDVKALIRTGQENDVPMQILESVEEVNEKQKSILFEKAMNHYSGKLQGCKFAIWGLSFKPNTDDMREAPAIALIDKLLEQKAWLTVYDPVAMDEARQIYGDRISYARTKEEALEGANALFLVTEWNEFRVLDYAYMRGMMGGTVIFDGRNIYDKKQSEDEGFFYYSIGQSGTVGVRY